VLGLVVARVAQGVVIVFLVTTVTFVLIHIAPGDPFSASSRARLVQREVVEQQRRNFGLDRPIAIQYVRYLANVARGNLGYSFVERRSVAAALRERIPNTLLLAGAALCIMFALGIAAGAVQGAQAGTRLDGAVSLISLVIYAMPAFWLALMLLLVFGARLDWFPIGGARDAVAWAHMSWIGRVADRLHHLVLPAVTLGAIGGAATARYQRAAMIEVVKEEFIRVARAKGLSERLVVWRHALRNALLPVITLFGLTFPIVLSGTVLVEKVFAWPGLGKLTIDAVLQRDYAVVTGAAILSAVMVVAGSLIADVLYRIVDPRTRGAT
jgi:peptide/nickel transport system permease protein